MQGAQFVITLLTSEMLLSDFDLCIEITTQSSTLFKLRVSGLIETHSLVGQGHFFMFNLLGRLKRYNLYDDTMGCP